MKNKQRIIPCLDVDNGRVVKGTQFKNIKDIADPIVLAKAYNEAGADELVFYDITATSENHPIFIELIQQISKVITIPFTVGGGIRSLEDMRKVFEAGANKVSINSAAINRPELIQEAAEVFGKERIVVSMDVKETAKREWKVFINGGMAPTSLTAEKWSIQAENLGAGELVLNSIAEDGVQEGYDLALMKQIRKAVQIPIVASGGAGVYEHFKMAFDNGVDGALAASIFHSGKINIRDLKDYLQSFNDDKGE